MVYINIVWRTSIMYGVHQYCMAYINIVWCTSILCGVHQYCVAYINIVWRTSIMYGVHPYRVVYIHTVWCTSIFSGVQECDTWNSIAKVHAKAGHSHEVVLEAFHKAAELAQTPQQKVRGTMSAGCTPLMTPPTLLPGWCAQSRIAVPSVPFIRCRGGGGGGTLGGETLPAVAGAP